MTVVAIESLRLLSEEEALSALHGSELAAAAAFSPWRRREFSTSRVCAREAMVRLGIPSLPVARDVDGVPEWPDGLVGSIAHCAGFYGAALCRRDVMRAVGIDVEPDAGLPRDVLQRISLPEERDMIAALPPTTTSWDRLLFSAKEAVYKAFFPRERVWRDFNSVRITINPAGTFSATRHRPEKDTAREVHGRWAARGGFVATAVAVG